MVLNPRGLVLGVVLLSFTTVSCAAIPWVTNKANREIIENKLSGFHFGTQKQEVLLELGEPSYIVEIPNELGLIEVYGFEYGYPMRSGGPIIVFKEQRFVGAVDRPKDLLELFQILKVIPKGTVQDFKKL